VIFKISIAFAVHKGVDLSKIKARKQSHFLYR